MGQGNIIGYEINEKTCQISFYNEQQLEPETLEVDADNYQIPLIIGKLRDTWAYGKEAKRLATNQRGICRDQTSREESERGKDRIWGGDI